MTLRRLAERMANVEIPPPTYTDNDRKCSTVSTGISKTCRITYLTPNPKPQFETPSVAYMVT